MSGVRWYKGNLHTHTLKSDGDASPEKVARWYGRHGYDFLTLSLEPSQPRMHPN